MKIRSYDIVVVGGGLVGAAIAYGLAGSSRRVAVLDEGDRALVVRDAVANGTEMVDRGALMKSLPGIGPDVAGASYCATDGQVNPLRLLRALHAAFAARGGTFLSECAVHNAARQGQAFALATATGPIHAARVVLAAGLGNAALAPQLGLSAPVRAQRGQIIALERLPAMLPLPCETLRQTDSGTILAGDSQEETASTDTSTGVLSAIAARAARAFPCPAGARIARCWAALRVLSRDRYPIYQQSTTAPGAFLATCHSGVTLAAAHALELAPQIGTGTLAAPFLPFSADRFDVAAAV